MKKLFQKTLALSLMLLMSVSMWGAIDWSGIGWVANSGDKFKVGALSAANMPMEIINVQQPGFATKPGIYMTFPAAVNVCSHECGIQGGGICLYIDQFTAKETEVSVNYAGGSKTFVVFYADGTEGSVAPESKFCATSADAVTEPHGSCSPLFTINTLDDGNVKIVISAGEGLDGETKFRNTGMNGTFTLNNPNADFATYFDKGKTDDYTYMLTLKNPANKPADGAIISYSGQIECRSNINTDDWSSYKLDDYVYGSKCPTDVAVTGVTLDQTEASVPVNKTLTLIATIAPANAANKNIIWTSSNEAIAKVVDGVVTPQAVGDPVTITARTVDGNFTATCAVTITAALPTEPTAAPEAPAYTADKVKAVYSVTYSADCGFGEWSSGTTYQQDTYGKKYTVGNGYFGITFEGAKALNCATMEYLHLDVWAADEMTIRIVPIHTGCNDQIGVTKTLSAAQWNSFNIPLGDFNNGNDWSNVYQIKIDQVAGHPALWFNNIYFYTTQDLDTEKPVMTSATLASASFTSAIINVAATDDRGVTKYIVKNGDAEVGKFVPADGKITVTGLTDGTAYTLSIYAQDGAENVSNNKMDVALTTLAMPDAAPAPDVAAKDYRAVYAPSLTNMLAHDFTLQNWGSADGVKMNDKGYIFYHTTNNATVVWGENNAGAAAIVATDAYKGNKGGLDASGMEYMHVDIWADQAGCNSLVLVVNDHNVDPAQTLNAGWNSLDIALSGFNPLNPNNNYLLDNVAWIKFVGLNNTNDVAITNVYFWVSTSTTKTVSATKNIAEAGTAVVKQNGVEVTEAENGSEVTFHAEENDGYVFLGWYAGAELKSTNADYVVTVEGNTTLQAKFRALNNIYCHTELTSTDGDKHIFLTMKRTAENQYQVVIDSEEEMNGFSNAYIGGINGASQIKLNDAGPKAENVVLSDNKHRLTVNVASTTPIKWNTPVYINMPSEFTFNAPNQQTIEYDVTCEPVAVASVTLNQTEATVDVEGTVTLAATASPIYADNQTVVWTSDNETVATVENGVVTGVAEGEATITVTIDGKTATCAITVALDPTVPHVAAPAVDATGKEIRAIYSDDVALAITNADFGLNVYGNAPYVKNAIAGNNYLLYTAEEDKQVISWGSGNGWDGALIGKDGMTDPDDAGAKGLYAADMKYLHIDIWSSAAATNFQIQNDNTLITMVDLDGSGWQSFDIDMTGKENLLKNISIIKFTNTPRNTKVALDNLYFWKSNGTAAVTGVELNKATATIEIGEQTTLVATVLPAVAGNKNVTWATDNAEVATVVDGVVTGVAAGTATITVTTEEGDFTASCVVTVTGIEAKTFWGTGRDGELELVYSITRNADKTLTYTARTYGGNVTVRQVNDARGGDENAHWHTMSVAADGEMSWTSTATYEKGATVKGFFYFPARIEFTYTVGSESAEPFVETRENLVYDRMYTYCPTQDVHFMRGVEFYVPENFDGFYINLMKVDELKAGYGYIMIPTADKAEVVFSGDVVATAVTASAETRGMQGYLGAGQSGHLTGHEYVFVKDNHLQYANDNWVTNGKAYIVLDIVRELTAEPENPAPRRRVGFAGTVATDFENVNANASVNKLLINGQVFILRGAKMYNVQGQLVK